MSRKDLFEKLDPSRREFVKKLLTGAAFAAPVMLSFPMGRARAQSTAAPVPSKTSPLTAPRPVVYNQIGSPPRAVVNNQTSATTPRRIFSNQVDLFEASGAKHRPQIVYVNDSGPARPIPYNQVAVKASGRAIVFNSVSVKLRSTGAKVSAGGVLVAPNARPIVSNQVIDSRLGRAYYANSVYFVATPPKKR